MSRKPDTLDSLIDALAKQVGKSALKLPGERLPDKVDVLKVLTTLKSVKSRGQHEPEGGGIDDFAKLFGGPNSVVPASAGDGPADGDDPEFDPTESTGVDQGVSGDLDGVGGEASADTPAPKRNGHGVGSD